MGGRGYFDPGVINKPLLHTWSLGVEEQFYLVFPWLLMLAARRGYGIARLIAGAVALSFALSVVAGVANWSPSYFLLPTRFWELGLGGLIAALPLEAFMTPLRRAILGMAGLAAILWACLFLTESNSFPGYLALAPVLGAAALIMANGGPAGRLMALPPFAWIGRLSFALYLWHWPLISVGAGLGLSPGDTATRTVVIVLSLALSFAGYHLWEMPIRQRRLLRSRRALSVALIFGVAALVAAGIGIYTAKGFPHRLPKDIADTYLNTKTGSRLVIRSCPEDKSKGYSCPVGAQDAKAVSFFIIGDSHSEAAAAEIGDVAAQYGLRGLFFGQSACKLFTEPAINATRDCIQQTDLSMASFKQYGPGLVIAVARWPDYLKDDSEDKELPNRYHAMYEVFGKTLSFFEKSRVVTATSIPTYNVNIAEFAGHNWFRNRVGLAVPPVPTLPLSEYRERQAAVRSLLEAEQLEHPNLSLVDPATVLCPDGLCVSTLGGKPLYYDNNHLSHAGAMLYASMFKPYFAELAQRLAAPAAGAETAVVPPPEN